VLALSPPKFTVKKILSISNVLTVALVAVIGLNIWYFTLERAPVHALEAMMAPEISLPIVVAGAPSPAKIALSDNRGKVVLIDFWALHCPPCKDMMPHVQALVDELPADDFALMSVNVDEETPAERSKRIANFLEEGSYRFMVGLGDARTLETYQVERLPTMMIVDRSGRVYRVYVGRTPSEIIRGDLDELIKAGSDA
jgi:cytochrome c biogenesis protein CcmG/thiol:disulfide interchange protein DsbE